MIDRFSTRRTSSGASALSTSRAPADASEMLSLHQYEVNVWITAMTIASGSSHHSFRAMPNT